ncbi:hypothetical protein AGABI1DRAFT_116559 [Agaricus bisporus var. burnettii JB137-S8]|uniref:Uncharacterized protein n=2 Tax=Agaricus bisporus var. burnettii TaxID=192524 RepID=K5VL85_AGABU|nr:uncharacterized protein AGABI1DRAFT_116559 [Agaricus bisporus var. burnettii JB137-S8]EKM75129.1 hypothetical protein AGABI1DRAFT_116559 [Agaricus bisporus var. burnettii JB137-S8]KAF7761643.1 hypothetical protein Agabi119p4_9635 [Agaricus bisporus var. burnettii]
MPAPSESVPPSTPVLGHVNLMLDTFIANASIEDLRAITRNMLATNPSSLTQTFTACARTRLRRPDNTVQLLSAPMFQQSEDGFYAPTASLYELLSRTRKLYGVGIGSSSLPLLTAIVRATIGVRWRERGEMAELLTVIDNDISQAIQSTKEEVINTSVDNMSAVRDAAEKLKQSVTDCKKEVKTWNGKFPFGRAEISIHSWKP